MKYLLLVIVLVACSSRRVQEYAPPYNQEKVCSADALEYLAANKKLKTGPKTDTDLIRGKMKSLHAMAKSCYDAELHRGGLPHHFNLCFVAGFDSNGEQEFTNFHTNEVDLSSKFYNCLYQGARNSDFSGLKDLTLIQPFKFRPITKN